MLHWPDKLLLFNIFVHIVIIFYRSLFYSDILLVHSLKFITMRLDYGTTFDRIIDICCRIICIESFFVRWVIMGHSFHLVNPWCFVGFRNNICITLWLLTCLLRCDSQATRRLNSSKPGCFLAWRARRWTTYLWGLMLPIVMIVLWYDRLHDWNQICVKGVLTGIIVLTIPTCVFSMVPNGWTADVLELNRWLMRRSMAFIERHRSNIICFLHWC